MANETDDAGEDVLHTEAALKKDLEKPVALANSDCCTTVSRYFYIFVINAFYAASQHIHIYVHRSPLYAMY